MICGEGANGGDMHKKRGTIARRLSLRFRTKWTDEAGAELFEAALVLPVLLILLFGIISFGRAYNVYQTITRAAREGARELVLTTCATCGNTSYSAAAVRTGFVEPSIAAANLDTSKISNYATTYVWLDPNDPTPNICGVQISFDYPYTLEIPFTSQRLSTLTLSAQVQMRMENQPTPCAVGSAVP
jgi:Flp pilus assembly protein TadG